MGLNSAIEHHPDRRLSVAPMMDWTDRHDRYFLRQISRCALLYSEMLTAPAVIHGDRDRLLGFSAAEHPVALQLGGADPAQMAEAAEIGAARGYDEININVGCPSDRVQSGRFGACLMAEPETVAACFSAMQAAVSVPVTVKSRIGIDDRDSYDDLRRFIDTVADAGCRTFIVHARKAVLQGLSPKENRDVPPLRYELVYRLKQDCPEFEIIINGGIRKHADVAAHLAQVDGVMIGREAYQNPWFLHDVDAAVFDADPPSATRHDAVHAMRGYIMDEVRRGTRLHAITRHMLGLFNGQPGARAWRRYLSENAPKPGAGIEVVDAALALVGSGDLQRSA